MKKQRYNVGDKVRVIKVEPLLGRTVAPPLEIGKEYTIESIIYDSAGNQHINVGLPSMYNFITSFETDEQLPKGDSIHWCHPSRFELINYFQK